MHNISKLAAFVALLVPSIGMALAPSAAQQQLDLNAIQRRFHQFYEAGNYAAALKEAQNLEAGAKARLGTNNEHYSSTVYNLALAYAAVGKYAEAEQHYKKALAIDETLFGPGNRKLVRIINNLAIVNMRQGKHAEAEELYQWARAILTKELGDAHVDVGFNLDNLGLIYHDQGRYAEAEAAHKRGLAIMETALGPDAPDVAQGLNNLAVLYQAQGRYGEAEALQKRALAIKEKRAGRNKPTVAASLDNLANLYEAQGRYADAEALSKRALAIYEKSLGKEHPEVAGALNNLGNRYHDQGKYGEAEAVYRRALAILEKTFGPEHPTVAGRLTNLANVYMREDRYADAERLLQRAVAIGEKALGPDHPDLAYPLNNLGHLYLDQGRYADAEPSLKRALAIREKAFGADHPITASTLNNLAILFNRIGDSANALAYSRRATASVIAHATAEATGAPQIERAGGLVEQRSDYFVGHVAHLAAAVEKRLEIEAGLGHEAFAIAQWAKRSAAAAAVQQMGLRFAAGTDALAGLVRERQDLSAFRQSREKLLLEALSKLQGEQNPAAFAKLRKDLAETESKLAANVARLEREFPAYAELSDPKPLNVADVQRLLGADEAMVFFLTGGEQSYVFAVSRESFAWSTIGIGGDKLSENVTAFREGLDLEKLQKSAGKAALFNLGLAHELYAALFGRVEPLIKDKKHLLIVPSGALTALPFHLLATEKPTGPAPDFDNLGAYRDAAWLIKRQAVTVLPSVATLRALRTFAKKRASGYPLIGFGDPVFSPDEPAASGAERAANRVAARKQPTRAYTDFWQGASVDRDKLAEALPRLEDTAEELSAVAKSVGALAADLYLREMASETNVKLVTLADYKVIYFATHGLVAGEVKGLAEPSLVLTIPKRPSDLDDGLLTASEVAELKLNADWVVLSACNTIAGEKPGAEALSGLARAFFYAGARALLVSHWKVASDAATRLTTSAFNAIAIDPKIGRAEALRQSMLAYMNDKSAAQNAYPASWGPFALIGEGAVR